jgi:quercetin dioxygenase-like cupin family protein
MAAKRRIRWFVAVAAAGAITASVGLATVALASQGSGTITPNIIATGSMPTGMGLAVHPGTNTIVGQYTFGPHSSTGWHSHPGKTLVVVQSGTFTVYHDNCHAMTYGPGSSFVELPSSVHVGRNETDANVVLGVVYFDVPIGGSPRIDQPQPAGCDVS